MSKVSDVTLVVEPRGDDNGADISFWVGSNEPRSNNRGSASVGPSWGPHRAGRRTALGRVQVPRLQLVGSGHQLPRLGEVPCPGGGDALEVARAGQLLIKEDGGSHFQLYMFKGGGSPTSPHTSPVTGSPGRSPVSGPAPGQLPSSASPLPGQPPWRTGKGHERHGGATAAPRRRRR